MISIPLSKVISTVYFPISEAIGIQVKVKELYSQNEGFFIDDI